eukprot:NODE_1662_length_1646_cov_134.525279_g1583_i0.p1 GENE.NODE_1662_length_1646_cov_134.525279_g1583_i0~~NODE_1662_length_1646_cov_134.525279_g1583_i0.p1  ORF type:complete len:454 (+),score=50.36 NODE_1662_length_1646_cov_134.525279_g1583_i0:56-1363(+)
MVRSRSYYVCTLIGMSLADLYPQSGLVLNFPNGITQGSAQGHSAPTVHAGTAVSAVDGTRGTITHVNGLMAEMFDYNGPDPTGAFTVMLWYKPLTAHSGDPTFIAWGTPGNHQHPHLIIDSSGHMCFDYYTNRATYSDLGEVPAAGTWKHLCITKATGTDPTSTLGYVGAVLSAVRHTTATAVTNTPGSLLLGNSGGFGYRDSYIDDLRVYVTELSAGDVTLAMNGATFGSVMGDPHFTSFSGGTFDITGKPGKIYTIISTVDFTWNVKLIARHLRTRPSSGTEVGDCGIRVRSHSIGIRPAWDATVDGVPIAPASPKHCHLVNDSDSKECIFWKFAKVAVIKSECYRLTLLRARKFRCAAPHSLCLRTDHLNFHVLVLKKCPSHGILGQTASFKHRVAPRGYDGEGVIEGTVDDYEVTSLFSTDFKSSLFNNSW